MGVSVAIVSWGPLNNLLRAICSVSSQTIKPKEIVIVDNRGVIDDDALKLETQIKLRVIRSPFNLGCPPARNIAFANCTEDWIYSLDDDGWLDSTAIEAALSTVDSTKGAAIVQSQIRYPDHREQVVFYGDKLFAFTGGACLINKSAFFCVGGYPMHFFRQGEEQHLILRLLDAGYTVANCPTSVMFHDVESKDLHNETESVYGFIHSIRTVVELFPLWAIPFGVIGKTLSWATWFWARGRFSLLLKGFVKLLSLHSYAIQPAMKRVSWKTVYRLIKGNRKNQKKTC